jgi:hypothetical protein
MANPLKELKQLQEQGQHLSMITKATTQSRAIAHRR